MRRLPALLVLLAAAVLGSCDSGPVAGDLTFSLTTPRSDDGAFTFRVATAAPRSIAGATALCAGCRVFLVAVADSEVRGIVTGAIAAGPVFSLTVSDTRTPSDYAAAVLDVSARDFITHASTGYLLAPAAMK